MALPDAATLAALVSNVTETLFGGHFTPADDTERGQSICGRMVMLPIPGPRDIKLVLSCDAADARTLGAAMRGSADTSPLTAEMIDDAIAEFLNMIAGQIQGALSIDQQLGLPRRTTLGEIAAGGVGFDDAILLTNQALGHLKLWIFETAPADPDPAAPRQSRIRSLFRKLAPRA